ncbi:MAG: Clp protease N-terminal domain-containing protein [Planctomycetaceae bacterium]
MFERFTEKARSSVVLAQEEARALDAAAIGTEHLLLGILREPTSVGARVLDALGVTLDDTLAAVRRAAGSSGFGPDEAEALRNLGIDLDEVRRSVEATFGPGALEGGRARSARGRLRFEPAAKKALELALREAAHLGHAYLGTEHLLLGLVRDARSTAARILGVRGITGDDVRVVVLRELAAGEDPPGRTG